MGGAKYAKFDKFVKIMFSVSGVKAFGWGEYGHIHVVKMFSIFEIPLLYFQIMGNKLMYGCNVHEALYLNCKFITTGSGVQALG